MDTHPLPFHSSLARYEKQAAELLEARGSGDPQAIEVFHRNHPRFLDDKIVWLPKDLQDSEIRNAALDLADAQLALARWYSFQDWPALADYVHSVHQDSAIFQFESAIEALIAGDSETLKSLLRENPQLVRARSTRRNHHDPPRHCAMLLHYLGANGVEGHRQKTPPNAVDIMKVVLNAGAEIDALAYLYGGGCTTMSLLVSSCHPANAGLQVALTETLLDFGASIDGVGDTRWRSPLMTALIFGYLDTAATLARRGARIDNIAAAAGLGRLDEVKRLLPTSDPESRHRALALSAQLGHADVVRALLDAGEDPDRYNPDGFHSHSTPLHQAALAGRDAVVRLLVERGARLDIKDKIYQGTPLGWAEHGGKTEIANFIDSVAQA
jgi:hypothetical protein